MASLDLSTDEVVEDVKPIVLIISDARGDTAYSVVVASFDGLLVGSQPFIIGNYAQFFLFSHKYISLLLGKQ